MNENDFYEFVDTWKGTHEVYNNNLTDAAIAISFKVLSKYSLGDVKGAIANYLADPNLGSYPPKPADIVKQLVGKLAQDGRPEADEAWAIAVQSFDEYQTVVLNDEIAKALEMSRPIYLDGDKVGARMAFRAAYDREVEEARNDGRKVKWFPSLGFDVHGRKSALEKAVDKGLLSRGQVQPLLPQPMTEEGSKVVALLMGKASGKPNRKETMEQLQKLKDSL